MLTGFAEDWVQQRAVPQRQMPTLHEAAVWTLHAYELFKQKYKKKQNVILKN